MLRFGRLTSALIRRAWKGLERDYGPRAVPVPSQATAYRRVKTLPRGSNAVSGVAALLTSDSDSRPFPRSPWKVAVRRSDREVNTREVLTARAREPARVSRRRRCR